MINIVACTTNTLAGKTKEWLLPQYSPIITVNRHNLIDFRPSTWAGIKALSRHRNQHSHPTRVSPKTPATREIKLLNRKDRES